MPLRAALARARPTSAASPSTATTRAVRRASGSEKLPRPQNRSSTVSVGSGSSTSSARSIIAWFKRAVDLHEVGGLELDRDVVLRQPVAERRGRPRRIERRDRVGPARLQVDAHGVLALERGHALQVGRRRRIEHAQHERDGVVGHGHFGLRHAARDR